ncbi:MAG: hypothetical protein EOP62_18540 [Sphingomonadales bacterium]|nr:MAG: hypothetical protein EOP62_18540 [Sphingomonadales bacterium]
MKFVVLAAAAAAAFVSPAIASAQTAPAAAPAAPATAPAAKFSADTPIVDLYADAKATEALTALGLGDIPQHPAYPQFSAMSFRAVAPYSEGKVTDELIAKIDAALAAIK